MPSIGAIVDVLSTLFNWAENNETLVLAMVTTVSVLVSSILSKRMIEENSELVEANKKAIEETRKDHRRESVIDLIIQLHDLRDEIPRPRNYSRLHSNGPYSVGRGFSALDEWQLEIPDHVRRFIREETTSDPPDVLSLYDEYKNSYKEYNNEYDSTKRGISIFLKNQYDTINWPERRLENPELSKFSGRSLTIKGAKEKLRDEHEKIAENIISKGVVFGGHKNEHLSEIVYDAVEDRFSEEFDYLSEEPQNLQDQYENLTRSTSWLRTGYISAFIENLRDKYSIPEVEIDQQVDEEDSLDAQFRTLIDTIEDHTVSVDIDNESSISHGTVYLKHADYDKEREDIDRDDYESIEEYSIAIEEKTPGKEYDSIEILANGWVRCTNEIRGKTELYRAGEVRVKTFTDIYPLDAIERITHSTTRKEDSDE